MINHSCDLEIALVNLMSCFLAAGFTFMALSLLSNLIKRLIKIIKWIIEKVPFFKRIPFLRKICNRRKRRIVAGYSNISLIQLSDIKARPSEGQLRKERI